MCRKQGARFAYFLSNQSILDYRLLGIRSSQWVVRITENLKISSKADKGEKHTIESAF